MSNHNNPYDDYPTPYWCFEALDRFIDFSTITSFLEPCAGDGRIINWITEKCKNGNTPYCVANDIQGPYKNKDYLTINYSQRFDLIITNPPYSLGFEFAQKMVKDARIVVSLHRIDFLGSATRRSFFLDNPLYALYVLSKRPSFTKNKKTDQYNYAWFVWKNSDGLKMNLPKPGIQHI